MTAEFNTNIDIPFSGQTQITYDLDSVITKSGFRDNRYSYEIVGKAPQGVSIDSTTLIIESTARYGVQFTVQVTTPIRNDIAFATTTIFGFNGILNEYRNNERIALAKQDLINNWSAVVNIPPR